MDKKITFTGGEPDWNVDDVLRNSTADREALFGIARGLLGTTNARLSKAFVTVNTLVDAEVTDGYVWLDLEVLQVDAATVPETLGTGLWEFQKVVTYDSAGDKTFNDAIPRQTWQKNRAVLVNVATITGMDAVNSLGLDNLRERVRDNEASINYDSGVLACNITLGGTTIDNYVRQKGDVVTGRIRLYTVGVTGSSEIGSLPEGIAPPVQSWDFAASIEEPVFTIITITTEGKILGVGISDRPFLSINFTYTV